MLYTVQSQINNSYRHQAITWSNVDPYPAAAFSYEKPPAPPTSPTWSTVLGSHPDSFL